MKYQTLFLLLVVTAACGDDDGTTDASTAADAATDARQTTDARPTPDSGPATCEMPGATRNAVCGMCGMRSESCEGGFWSPQSECLGQGECSVGEVDTEDTPMCGRRQRLCLDGCTWGDWEALEEDGECAAGETAMRACADGVLAPHVCGDDCTWSAGDSCMTECGPREALPIDDPLMERICIPAGPTTIFYEGSDGELASRSPTVSAFWIMKYPVANRLYSMCEECGDPVLGFGLVLSKDPEWAVHVRSGDDDPDTFCEFVGGALSTLTEFTRAARGGCDLFAPFPWSACDLAASSDIPSCETMIDCTQACATSTNSVCAAVTAASTLGSDFGVERLIGPSQLALVEDQYAEDLGPAYDELDPHPSGDNRTILFEALGGRRRPSGSLESTFRCVWRAE